MVDAVMVDAVMGGAVMGGAHARLRALAAEYRS